MSWTPHVTVAVIVEQQQRFLVVEEQSRDVAFPVYNQPAGHVEAGETLVQACLRETLEETSYQVKITDLLGIYTYTPPAYPDKTYYRFCFIAQVEQQLTQPLDPDILAVHWLTADEIEQSGMARSPLVMQCIRDYQAGKRIPLSVLNEDFLTPKSLFIET